jgi:ribosomal protein L7/L12
MRAWDRRLLLAANWFLVARRLRRREQLGFGQGMPEAGQDVLTLVRQGRKIEAIKRYRQLNPGIGLREAKHVVDGLQP